VLAEETIEALARGDMTLSRAGTLIPRKFRHGDWDRYDEAKRVGYCVAKATDRALLSAYWDWAEVHQRPAVEIRRKVKWAKVVVDLITVRGVDKDWVWDSWCPALKQLAIASEGMRWALFGTWSEIEVTIESADSVATHVVALWASKENEPKFSEWLL
jgi:hypothetical protein